MKEKGQEKIAERYEELHPDEKKIFIREMEHLYKELVEERRKQIKPGRRGFTKKKVKELHKWVEGELPKISVDNRALCDLIEVTHGDVACYVPATMEGMCMKFYVGFAMIQTLMHNIILEQYDYTLKTGHLPDPKDMEDLRYAFERTASNMYKAFTFAQPDYIAPKGKNATLAGFMEEFIKLDNKLTGSPNGHLVPLRETLESLNKLKDKIPQGWNEAKQADGTLAEELLDELRKRGD